VGNEYDGQTTERLMLNAKWAIITTFQMTVNLIVEVYDYELHFQNIISWSSSKISNIGIRFWDEIFIF
jgi:hypothetical protein